MTVEFERLIEPTSDIVEAYNRWENDPALVPLIRPNKDKDAAEKIYTITEKNLRERLLDHEIHLIYAGGILVGEMNYMVNPGHLFDNKHNTAWIGITIGEREGRGKGIGYQAVQYLEEQIKVKGLNRVELGVFEYNKQALALYKKLGYQEIARIPEFTYNDGRMWADIRMEKFLQEE